MEPVKLQGNQDRPIISKENLLSFGILNRSEGIRMGDTKPRLTKEQHDVLEYHFQYCRKPTTSSKKEYAEHLGVSVDKINNWFQNRRAKAIQDSKRDAKLYNSDILNLPTTVAYDHVEKSTNSSDADRPIGTYQMMYPPPSNDWSFLKREREFVSSNSVSPECPSLVSTSTISSRNSSTRTARSVLHIKTEQRGEFDKNDATKEDDPFLGYNVLCHPQYLDDISMLRVHSDCSASVSILPDDGPPTSFHSDDEGETISACADDALLPEFPRKQSSMTFETAVTTPVEVRRPETCPFETCKYHLEGFAGVHDRIRHTNTHFKGTMICGFCPDAEMAAENPFIQQEVFSQHLINIHGAAREPQKGKKTTLPSGRTYDRKSSDQPQIALCTLCTEPFDIQGFYDHLSGCVSRQIMRSVKGSGEKQVGSPSDRGISGEESPRNDSVISESEDQVASRAFRILDQAPVAKAPSTDDRLLEDQEMLELTASSRCLSLTSSAYGIKSSEEETDWTEDASSPSQSEPDAKRVLSPMKRQIVDQVMNEFHRVFDQSSAIGLNGLAPQVRNCNGGGSSGDSQHHHYISSNGDSSTNSSFASRKRSLSGRGSPPPNGNNNGGDPNKRRKPDSTRNNSQVQEKRFACPYYKRNPGRHQTYTSCRDPGFNTVARLKEHLYRRHLLPPQCHRCCSTFPNEPTLREHQRDPRGCEVQEHLPLEGFNKDQERNLKSKKRSQLNQNEEDKWKSVYRILFPDDDDGTMPSPYIEYRVPGNPASASNVTRFQEFSRLELPRLVRHTLEVVVEQEAQPLEDKLKDQLVNIVKECQTQLFALFQSSEGLLDACAEPSFRQQQPKQPQGEDESFQGFDSLNNAPVPQLAPPTPPYAANAQNNIPEYQKPGASYHGGAEDSPDSGTGYDHPWTTAGFQPDMALNEDTFGASASYPDVGAYYGLFQDQDMTVGSNGLMWGNHALDTGGVSSSSTAVETPSMFRYLN